ncbi:MAG: hypothetical protein ACR2NV_13755 [Thermoleophilaceae bacterium]
MSSAARTGRRSPGALLLAVLALLLLPGASLGAPLLEEPDAVELAQTLAEATAEQQVCYGWEVAVDDQSGEGAGGVEAGSSAGPGAPLDRASCPRWAIFQGGVSYTSESSESEDSAEIAIDSNLARPPTVSQLEDLGYSEDDLLGDIDDQAVIDMTNALPLLVAEAGEAPYIPFEPPTEPVPASDRPNDGPGSDWLRNYWWLPVLLLAGLGGVAYLAVKALMGRGTPPTTGSAPPSGPPASPRPQPPLDPQQGASA